MIQIHQVQQTSSEWLELRAGKYTGANAHKLLKFGTIDYSLTEVSSFKGNYWTERAHLLEAQAIEIYEGALSVTVDRPGFVTNSKFPKSGYSPDALRPDRTIEVKNFDKEQHLKLLGGEISLEIMAQIQYGMLICEKKLCDLVPYNPDLKVGEAFRIITVKAQPKVLANFRKILKGGNSAKTKQGDA